MFDHTHIYKLNEVALSSDLKTSHASDADAKRAAPSFKVGDGAFIRRSDKVWRYAKVCEVSLDVPAPSITFIVSDDGSTKKVGPRHWGDRVRPLKREMAVNRRGRMGTSRFRSKKDLRSSPQDIQISPELERTAQSAGGGESGRCVIDKLSDNGSDDTKNDDHVEVEVADEVVHKQGTRQNRRESWKDIASGFIKRLSGSDRVKKDTSLNLASETTINPEDMKICDSLDRSSNTADILVPQDTDEAKSDAAQQRQRKPKFRRDLGSFSLTNPPTQRKPIPTKEHGSFSSLTNPPTHQKGRKPNRREKGSFSLTTSALFKNLMNGGDTMNEILGTNDPSTNRRATVSGTTSSVFASDAATSKKAVGGNYKPKRNRRATVQSRAKSVAIRGGGPTSDMFGRSNSSRETESNNQKMAPRPSVIMKSAFQQLMENKAHSSKKRIVD
mmetsp:Transcript_5756/g.11245  ORF Transcript_5756/g.11245 Transcript_5756/m.11245 type:complete len:442 (+) Transcript_5756:118-1443(+)|eukprot:CAMPEP_0196130648 /NCGR_PEP_ID=MMETSP0910-20130528/946_1 /TAXON_ID=49265 /ORGANISM="Thalassiosira rotula, Strain GSO102" /LENGTH=441 /DNA_ID=CAMNT_0041389993 /DNA_START=115 /DNA_END=1440 /DNA_ORIENTATION=+